MRVILEARKFLELATMPFLVFLSMFVILEFNHLPVRAGLSVSLSFSSILAAYMTYGETGAVGMSLGLAIVGLLKKKSLRVILFNTSSVLFSAMAASWAARLVQNGSQISAEPFTLLSPALPTFVVAFMIVNASLVLLYGFLNSPSHKFSDFGYNIFLYAVHMIVGTGLALFMLAMRNSWGDSSFYLSCLTIVAMVGLGTMAGKYALNREGLVNLYRAASSINEALTLKEVFERAYSSANAILDIDFAWLGLPSDDENLITVEYTWAKPGIDVSRGVCQVLGLPQRQRAFSKKLRLYWNREKDKPRDGYFGTVLAMPLWCGNELVAEFGVARMSTQEVQRDTLQIFAVLSSHVALAVHNAIKFEKATMLAATDSLTGLYNRRAFQNLLAEALDKARKEKTPVSLIYIDLDYFRQVNNKYGHQAGDEVLQEISRIIRASCRESDLVSRPGGDEFTVILPGVSKQDARSIALRIKENLQKARFDVGLPKPLESLIGASVGVATFPEDGSDVATLVRHADMDMYAGKMLSGEFPVKPEER